MPPPSAPICYSSGEPALPGDTVQVDGVTYAVEHVIDSPAEIAEWETRQRGLMLVDAAYDLLFQPESARDWSSVLLVRRGETPPEVFPLT